MKKQLILRALQYTSVCCLALMVLAGVEALVVLGKDSAVTTADVLELYIDSVSYALQVLYTPLLLLLISALWKTVQGARGFSWRHLVVDALFGGGLAVNAYLALYIYAPFRDYLPFIAGCVALGVGATVMLGLVAGTLRLPSLGTHRQGVIIVSLGSIIGAAALYWANYHFFPGHYYPFHLAVMGATLTMLALGLLGLSSLDEAAPSRRPQIAVALATVAAVGLGAGAFSATEMAPRVRVHSVVGQSLVLFERDDGPLQISAPAVSDAQKRPPLDSYLEVFDEHQPLPELPDDFELEDYNVLLVTIEATRFIETSLADPSLDTTPRLAQLGERAYVNERAYSSSSGTLHSMSAALTMSYPSMIPLETWSQPWFGELDESATTVTESLADAGWETFWIGHNHNRHMRREIRGLGQGFDEIDLVADSATKPATDVDARIASKAVDKLAASSKEDKRFFGWVFFDSPHGPYTARYPDSPRDTELDRYRQEIRYADEQLGRLLEALRAHDLWENTIIIVTSDHGEEFREHGGTRHKSTVYSEVIHVPFVLRVPGMDAHSSNEPMSTMYVWPWLLLHGQDELAAPAEEAIETTIGPILHQTEGGVLTELVGHDRMKSTLVYPRYKVNYDLIAQFHELYDLENDPLEQQDIFRISPKAEQFERRMTLYRAFRAANERHSLRPEIGAD